MSGANDPTDAFKKDSPPPIDTVFPFLPGLDNMFVILRTNATQTPSKLSVHFATTLHCTPHYAIYSDLAEEIARHPIHDALAEIPPPAAISPNVLSSRPSTKAQRARLSSSRFAIPDTSTPLLAQPRRLAPLPNASAPLHLGTTAYAARQRHHRAVEPRGTARSSRTERGDCVLGMVLAAGGVAAARGWSRPAALSYRGGLPAEIESLWRFERKWYGQVGSSVSFFFRGWWELV